MKIHARTERLILRDWSKSDLEEYALIVSDPEVMKHIGSGLPRPLSYAEEFIDNALRHQESRGWMRFAVEHSKTGRLMGFCGLEDKNGRLDFGWRYARDFWGAGYGYEAAAAALWVSQNTFKLKKITSQSYAENVGSIRIIEKMGMTQIGKGTDYGRPLLIFGFSNEWPEGI